MNKRMIKFLVSLGMIVVLGSGNAFADNTMVTSELATYLKSAMDPADDYAVFANIARTGTAHFDGTLAANDATIETKIDTSNKIIGDNNNYIVTLNEDSSASELFSNNNNLALNTVNHTIMEEGGTYYWVKSNQTKVKMAANKYNGSTAGSGLRLYKITEAGLGTEEKPVSIETALENLEELSTYLTTKSGDKVVSIVNKTAADLTGTGDFNVVLNDLDEDEYGVTVVNVKIPTGTTEFTTGKRLTINGEVVQEINGKYNPIAGKVLFNFVNEDGSPYEESLTFGMGAGVILAPSATVSIASGTGSGNFNGSVLCNIFNGSAAQMHQVEFNLTAKEYEADEDEDDDEVGESDGFEDFNNGEETGDTLRYGAMAVVGLAGAGLAIVNRKGKDEE